MKAFWNRVSKGFTLIELLVVIAIIAILASFLIPAVNNAMTRGRVTQIISNGRGLYTLLFSKDLDNPLGLTSSAGTQAAWPATADAFGDSNEFFINMVTNSSFNLNFAFFIAPGIQPAADEAEFTTGPDLYNAWCITLDVGSSVKPGTPVLFTQNIDLGGAGNTLNDLADPALAEDQDPFGSKAAVIVAQGGSSFSIDADTAIIENFNPNSASNGFLYPMNGQY